MLLNMFTIYDSKTETYSPPFFMRTTGEAVRTFQDLSVDKDTSIGRYPADFTLFEVGTFDDKTGTTVGNKAFVNLGLALEHMPRSPGFERGLEPAAAAAISAARRTDAVFADLTKENGDGAKV